MNRLDLNKLMLVLAIVCLAALAVMSGYRLEIGVSGLKLERNVTAAAENERR
jgi:hypothetical protein